MAAATILSDILVSNQKPHGVQGVYPVLLDVTIPTSSLDDANDKVLLYKFPSNCRLWGLRVDFGDADTGGAPAAVVDISTATDTSGTVGSVLINDSTAAQSGANDDLDAGLLGIDVGGEYLMWHTITAAATGAAVSHKFYLLLSEYDTTLTHSTTVTSTRLAAPGEDVA